MSATRPKQSAINLKIRNKMKTRLIISYDHFSFKIAAQAVQIGVLSAAFSAGYLQAAENNNAKADNDSSNPETTLTTVVVKSYITERTLTGSKIALPIREIPQTISVVTKDQIEIQAAQSLDQVLGYSAGISAATGGATKTTDEVFSLRGFDDRSNSTIYVDGNKRTRNIYSGTTEPYALESVEVLKGPASSLYGRAAPGGIINLVMKKPTKEPLREIQLQKSTHDRAQFAADFGDALDAEGTWSYRLTGLYREADTAVDYIPDDRKFISPSLRFQPSADTSLTLRADYQQDNTMFNYGLPFEGTAAPNPNGKIRPQRFIGEPDLDKWSSRNRSIGYQFEHRFNETLTIRQNFLRFWSDTDYNFTGFGEWTDSQKNNIDRVFVMRTDEDSGFSFDTSLQFDFTTGVAKHALLVGVDHVEGRFTRSQNRAALNSLNLFEPIYNQLPVLSPSPSSVEGNDINQTGLYLQDHIKIGKYVVLSGGVRHDKVTLSTDYSEPGYSEAFNEDSKATTYNVGLVILTDVGLSPYASYSQAFQPNAGLNDNGKQFDPAKGDQIEAGIKYRPERSPIEINAAIFKIKQNDIIVNSSVGYGGGNQIDIESKGAELELHAKLTHAINVIAAYTYVNAKVTKSDIADAQDIFARYEKGNATAAQPKNSTSLWIDYQLPMFPALTLAAGARYIGDTTDFTSQYKVSAYTLFNAAARYDIDYWRFALNVNNLEDKEYVSACTYACYYGDGRSVVGTATYQW